MRISSSSWITASCRGDVCPIFRRTFPAGKPVKKAELQMTALGIYEAVLNGKRVSDYVLAPGWTSYEHRLQVQTYDVTDFVRDDNDLRVTVGRGWFRSPMPGWMDTKDKRRRYQQPCGLIALLTLRYTDGSEETIATDETWTYSQSSVRFSEIYDGEIYDARHTVASWKRAKQLDRKGRSSVRPNALLRSVSLPHQEANSWLISARK